MSGQGAFDFESSSGDADLLTRLIDRSERILVKKLSKNDRSWADDPRKHQGGIYIPHEQRDGGFFPRVQEIPRKIVGSDPIREAWLPTIWPQNDGEEKRSRLVHYTSKGQETHMTRVPKSVFAGLLPASLLLMGRVRNGEDVVYECLTIDSGSDEAALLADMLELDADFLIGEFVPADIRALERDRILDFAEAIIAAWIAGTIGSFATENATMPDTAVLAGMARTAFMERHGIEKIDPFTLRCPGDVLREISRSVELELFREYQRRERSVELVRIVMGDDPVEIDAKGAIRRLIEAYQAVDALMLSASQQRKSRAGYSYEHHIEAMLSGGGIPFEKQVIVEARKRPDFVLPSLAFVDSGTPKASTGLILSAKTTLRERWKQVEREKGHRRLFLTTVDENIAGNAIEDMDSFGVLLVIPESLMKSKEAEYAGHTNVISFRQFCDDIIAPNLTEWA